METILNRLKNPGELVRLLQSRRLLWPWLTRSYRLLLGTLLYNAFVLVFVQPALKRWFPPLNPWERARGLVGGTTRTTFEELVPVVGTTLWILGNGLIFALLHRSSGETHATVAEGGTVNRLEPGTRR